MQKIFLSFFGFFITVSSALALGTGDHLDLTITPIRSDLTATINKSTTGSITLYNNSDKVYSFIMSAEDCTTNTNNGTPLCDPIKSGSIRSNSLASWISFNITGTFSIPAKGKKTITYSIHTPIDAVPGGHYGAIFFNSLNSTTANISMNRRIGSLLLVTVPGNITVAPEFEKIIVGGGGISLAQPSIMRDLISLNQTDTVLEQTKEKGKKLLMVFSDPLIQKQIVDFINPFWSAPELDPNTNFSTELYLPVHNKGTIHINPEGEITLHEINGSQLTHIGKELIKNQNGVIIGEKIVDYLKINEESGNVLPGTSRVFTINWNGFAREYITSIGNIGINYESPGVYYSRISKENNGYLYPWEKLILKRSTKQLNAQINLLYTNPISNQIITDNYSIPLTIGYDEIIKTGNTGLGFIIIMLIILYLLFRRKKPHNKIAVIDDEITVLERAHATISEEEKDKKIKPRVTRKKAQDTPTDTSPAIIKKTNRKVKVPKEL